MCDPISASMAAISVGSSVLKYQEGQKQAAALNSFNQQQYAQEQAYRDRLRAKSVQQFRSDEQQIATRIGEEQKAAALQEDQIAQEQRAQLATLNATKASFGVGGVSAGEMATDIRRQAGEAASQTRDNLIARRKQLNLVLAGLAPDEIPDAAEPQKIKGPSLLGLGTDIAMAGIGSFVGSSKLTGATLGETGDAFMAGKMFDLSVLTTPKPTKVP